MTHEPRMIDCSEVLDRLYEFLDGELTPEREAEVKAHLVACAPCTSLSGFEASFIRFLEIRTRARKTPDSLRKKLLAQLLAQPDS